MSAVKEMDDLSWFECCIILIYTRMQYQLRACAVGDVWRQGTSHSTANGHTAEEQHFAGTGAAALCTYSTSESPLLYVPLEVLPCFLRTTLLLLSS